MVGRSLLALLFIGGSVHAGPPPATLPAELARCQTRVTKEKTEEQHAREAAEAANINDHEALARLLMSQAVASGYWAKRCQAPSGKALMEKIAWVVVNRAQKLSPDPEDPQPDAFFNTVFARGEFKLSFTGSERNPYARIFLCPMEAKTFLHSGGTGLETALALYRQAKEVAAGVMETYQNTGIPKEYAGINNLFLPYAESPGPRPGWAKNSDPKKNKGYVDLLDVPSKPCVEFYKTK